MHCPCDDCHNSNYDDCKFKDQFGEWQGRTMEEVPVRHNVPAAAEELEKFYKGKLGTDANPLLVAVNIQGLVDGGEGDQFSLAIVRTKAETANESIAVDELLEGSGWQIPIEKGQWYLRVQYLQHQRDANHVAQPGTGERFRLPPCNVYRSVPISALISPLLPMPAFIGIKRDTFLQCKQSIAVLRTAGPTPTCTSVESFIISQEVFNRLLVAVDNQ
jgi:hypothetical protein